MDVEAAAMDRRGAGQTETGKRLPPTPSRRVDSAIRGVRERSGCGTGSRIADTPQGGRTYLADGIGGVRRRAMQEAAGKWGASGSLVLSFAMLKRVYGHHHLDRMYRAVKPVGG